VRRLEGWKVRRLEGWNVGRREGGKVATWRRPLRRPGAGGVAQMGLRKRRRHGFRVFGDYCDNFRNQTQIGVSCLLQGGISLLNVFVLCSCLDSL